MKKILSVILTIIIALSLTVGVFAADDLNVKVNVTAENIVIDGLVTSEEWGEPIFTTTPNDTLSRQAMGWDYWSFTPAPAGQVFELYLTNDADYVYIAGKLIGANKDTSCPDMGSLWQYPHLTVTFAKFEEGLICPKIEFQGAYYEQYTCYSTGFVNGEPAQQCTSQGMLTNNLDADCFAVAYDDAERAYIYEYKIPMQYTNLDILSSDKICLGLDITDAPVSGQSGNRYLVSKAGERGMGWMGPGNFYFQTTNPLIIELVDTDSLRGTVFTPDKLVVEDQLPPTDPDYYENYELMTTTAICSAVAALFAAAAAVVVVLRKKSK